MASIDLSCQVGSVHLPAPVMTASGTAGHGTELAEYFDLSRLGAHVVKSLSFEPWAGNPPPRVHEVPGGMVNSVGLQGPGIEAWLDRDLPALEAARCRVVASIWGRSPEDYERAADALGPAGPAVVAVEVNLSCPNLHGSDLIAHDPGATAEVIAATQGAGRPRWAKLSPNTPEVVRVAAAARDAGAEAVTLTNTLQGLVLDDDAAHVRLGGGGGGLSGPAMHAVAVRVVAAVHRELGDLPIVGVGGVTDPRSAVDLLAAGARAVQVGTATFADPRAPIRVLDGLETWCRRRGVTRTAELTGSLNV